MNWTHRTAMLALAAGLIALPASATSSRQNTDHPRPSKGEPDLVPTGRGWGHHAQGQSNRAGKPAKPGSNGISYHNGPLILGTTNVYYIWYGNLWTGSSPEVPLLENFAASIGGSPYYNINTTYTNGSGTKVSNSVAFKGSMVTPAYLGNSLSDAQILQVVKDALAANAFGTGYDANAVYFVLTDKNTTASSGFCTQYCGWHTHASVNSKDIKYSFVGDSSRCPSSCQQQTPGPNGSTGADGMASIIAHELEEAVTDPDLNAWYDNRGYENADKCAWTFGTTSTASNGAKYNMTLGGTNYMIQQNWVNASGGYCAKSY